jgi:steroid delta-isomerase-like uncharacterized protein
MLLELIKKHLEAFEAGNWDDYKAGLASDSIYEESATQLVAKGPDHIVNTVQRWKRAFPDLKATFVGGFESADQAVAEVEWEGTHSGPLEGAFGTMPPTNQRGRVKAVLIVRMKDGKIVENHHYFDLLTILSQIGVAPGRGAPQPAATPGAAATPRH